MEYTTTVRILKEKTLNNLEKELETIAKSKFNHINLGFTEFQELLDKELDLGPIAKKCKELNLVSTTSHASIHWPFFFNNYYDRLDRKILENRIFKSIELSRLFEVEWIVLHIGTYLNEDGKYDVKKSIEYNKEYLDPFVKHAIKYDLKIAIENGTNQEDDATPYSEELIELVEYFNNKYNKEILGICFDFGHANLQNIDIYEEIKKIGNKLKVTHIHDNYGEDDHYFPYNGTINWNLAMKGLKEIGYKGELNLEVRYNSYMKELKNKDSIPVDLINNTYDLLERLENLMNNPDDSNINVICPRESNKKYTTRRAAYGIIKLNDKIAIAKEDNEYFLLGGGIEKGETELEALKREFIEETGYSLKNIKQLDKLKSYERSQDRGDLEVIATIYTAEFDKKVTEKIENNEVFECYAKDYKDKVKYEYQKYAIRKYINRIE